MPPPADVPPVASGSLVGRQRELSRILDGIARDIDSRLPGITCVWAPAGTGKTRLVRTAASLCDADSALIEADGAPGDDPFAAFVRSWFGTTGGSSPARDAETFDLLWDGILLRLELEGGALGRLRDSLRRTRPFLRGIAAGTPPEVAEPSMLAAGRRAALSSFLAALSVSQSLVVILENLHLFPAEAIETVREVLTASVGFPVSFLATSRPGSDGGVPPFPTTASLGRIETLHLEGLPLESLPGFVEGLTGLRASPETVLLLHERTGGVPLLLQHAVLLLRESGRFRERGGSVDLADGASLPADPGSLLAERIGLLPPPLGELVRAAAILGGLFSEGSLRELTGSESTAPLLQEAVRRHLLAEDAGLLRFSHESVRDAALATCSSEETGRLHRAAASMLRSSRLPETPGHLERIGMHLLLGGDAAEASGLLLRAAEGYAAVFENDAAESAYRRASILLPEPARTCAELALVEVQRNAGLTSRSVEVLSGTLERIAGHPDVDGLLRARVCLKLGMNLIVVGRTPEGEPLIEEALRVFRASGEKLEEAACLRHLGIAAQFAGRTADALEGLEASLGLSRETGDPAAICLSLYWLAIACRETGNLERLRALTEEQVALARTSGLVQSLLGGFDNLMRLHIYTGDFERAEAVHAELLATAEASGNWAAQSAASSKMGIIHIKRAEWEKAEECFRRCVVLTERTGNLRARCVALGNLAHAAIEQEKLDDAMEHAMTMIDGSSSLGFRLGVMSGYARMAYILDLKGAYEAAIECLETQIEHALVLGDTRNLSDGHATMARILLVLDRPEEALASVERALVASGEAGDIRLRSSQLELKGRLLVLLGRPLEARPILEEALELVAAQPGREKMAFYVRLYLEAALADLGDEEAPERLIAMAGESLDDTARAESFFQHWRITASGTSASEALRLSSLEHARRPQPILASRLALLRGHIT